LSNGIPLYTLKLEIINV